MGLETSNAWKSVQKSDGVDPPESAGKGAFLGLGAAPWPVGVRPGSDRAFHHRAGDSFMEHTWSPRAGHDSRRRAHSCVVLGKSLDPSERQFLHVRDCRVGRLQAAEILSSCRTRKGRGVCPPGPRGAPLPRWAGRGRDRPFAGSPLGGRNAAAPRALRAKQNCARAREPNSSRPPPAAFPEQHRDLGETCLQNRSLACLAILRGRTGLSARSRPALGPLAGRGREPGLSSPGDSSCGPGSHSPPGARRGGRCHPAGARAASVARPAACAAKPSPARRAQRARPRPPAASPRLSQSPSDLCERRLSPPGVSF